MMEEVFAAERHGHALPTRTSRLLGRLATLGNSIPLPSLKATSVAAAAALACAGLATTVYNTVVQPIAAAIHRFEYTASPQGTAALGHALKAADAITDGLNALPGVPDGEFQVAKVGVGQNGAVVTFSQNSCPGTAHESFSPSSISAARASLAAEMPQSEFGGITLVCMPPPTTQQ